MTHMLYLNYIGSVICMCEPKETNMPLKYVKINERERERKKKRIEKRKENLNEKKKK